MDNLEVTYNDKGKYSIVFEKDFGKLSEYISEFDPNNKKAAVITDTNVGPIYAQEVAEILSESFSEVLIFTIEAGEQSKCLNVVSDIYEFLAQNDFHRTDFLFALGGGVTGDITGYVASTYMRGIGYIQIPTSLLAMVDSSVGGKCGVDFMQFKNMVGSFYMQKLVYIAVKCLTTLPESEFSSGMAEALKSGLIRNASFYEWMILNFDEIMSKDIDALENVIENSIYVKHAVVTKDPFETGERMILNFGHTIGHALEKYYNFEKKHGECVALGMVAAAFISWKRQLLSMEEYYEIRDMFVPFNLPISVDDFDVTEVYNLIQSDKKVINSRLNFVLLKKIGKAVIVNDVSEDEIMDSLKELIVSWED